MEVEARREKAALAWEGALRDAFDPAPLPLSSPSGRSSGCGGPRPFPRVRREPGATSPAATPLGRSDAAFHRSPACGEEEEEQEESSRVSSLGFNDETEGKLSVPCRGDGRGPPRSTPSPLSSSVVLLLWREEREEGEGGPRRLVGRTRLALGWGASRGLAGGKGKYVAGTSGGVRTPSGTPAPSPPSSLFLPRGPAVGGEEEEEMGRGPSSVAAAGSAVARLSFLFFFRSGGADRPSTTSISDCNVERSPKRIDTR